MKKYLMTASVAVLVTAMTASASMAMAATDVAKASVAEAPADDSQALGEIVVTATKRETNLQKTPIAISVLDQPSGWSHSFPARHNL